MTKESLIEEPLLSEHINAIMDFNSNRPADYCHMFHNAQKVIKVLLAGKCDNQREIAVVEENVKAILEYEINSGCRSIAEIMRRLRPYLRQPVPVSITRCLEAVDALGRAWDDRTAAKAVLDAAGVKYVD